MLGNSNRSCHWRCWILSTIVLINSRKCSEVTKNFKKWAPAYHSILWYDQANECKLLCWQMPATMDRWGISVYYVKAGRQQMLKDPRQPGKVGFVDRWLNNNHNIWMRAHQYHCFQALSCEHFYSNPCTMRGLFVAFLIICILLRPTFYLIRDKRELLEVCSGKLGSEGRNVRPADDFTPGKQRHQRIHHHQEWLFFRSF